MEGIAHIDGARTYEMGEVVEYCPMFGRDKSRTAHEWAQVDSYHTEHDGGLTDLVRCVYCLTYLEVVRP